MGSCFINALEENNYAFFSKPEFFLCFLKRYARQLGIDSEEVIRRFAVQYELDLQKNSYLKNHSDTFRSWEKHKRFRRGLIFGAILILIILIIGFLFLNKPPKRVSMAILASKAKEPKIVLISMILLSSVSRERYVAGSLLKEFLYGNCIKISMRLKTIPKELSSALGRVKAVGNRQQALPPSWDETYIAEVYRVEFDSEEEAIRAGYHKAPK
jgi:hypothetical protein